MILSMLLLACGSMPDAPPPGAPLPGSSVYQVPAKLETHTGEAATLALHRGHPAVLTMFYASCPMACPLLVQDLKSLEAALSDEERADLRVLLISLDPARDTPEVMGRLLDEQDLDPARWTLARPAPEDVRSIAAVLGVRYRPAVDGEMNHSSILTLVDGEGRVVFSAEGLGRDPEPMIRAIRRIRE